LRGEVRDLVAELQRSAGVTTLFVTHDQEEATVLADRVALMLDGRLQQVGAPRDFYERPASVAVARFFGTANAFPGWCAPGAGGVAGRGPRRRGRRPRTLLLRQEAVRLVGPEHPGTDAVVLRTTYTGTGVRAWADAGGTEVALVAEPTARLAAGDRVRLHLPPDRCSVVPS
jgi:ABC-type Fe3+/spermidine/putrescine transport system ATPase subunit